MDLPFLGSWFVCLRTSKHLVLECANWQLQLQSSRPLGSSKLGKPRKDPQQHVLLSLLNGQSWKMQIDDTNRGTSTFMSLTLHPICYFFFHFWEVTCMAIIPQKISGNDHKKDFFNDLTSFEKTVKIITTEILP